MTDSTELTKALETGESTETLETGESTETTETTEETKKRTVILTFEKRVNQYRRAIELSLTDEALRQYAGEYGYSPERIANAKALLEETETLYEDFKSKRASQRAATRALKEAKKKANDLIQHFLQTLRLAFKDNPDILDALGIRGSRKQAFGDWVAQNKLFYNKILEIPQVSEELAKYNVTLEQVNEGKQLLLDTIAADTHREDTKAEAQRATEAKNKAFRKLKRWMSKYYKVMKVALEDDPQLQEKLGIIVPSSL
jgi:phosphopantetheinyl transferase (holo-ACP synthase)